MENLNAEQVKKALGCCTRSGCSDNETKDCPLKPYEDCTTRLATNALALINSQEQRIGELAEEIKDLTETVEVRGKVVEQLQILTNEIEEDNRKLTEENERLIDELAKSYEALDEAVSFYCSFTKSKIQNCPIDNEVAKAKADTVRELTTRFAMCFGTYTDKDMTPITEAFRRLDQIAKEMLEDADRRI